MLVRLLRRRFGPLAPDVEARIHDADSEWLEEWCERIFDARELNDVFSDGQQY